MEQGYRNTDDKCIYWFIIWDRGTTSMWPAHKWRYQDIAVLVTAISITLVTSMRVPILCKDLSTKPTPPSWPSP